MDFNKFKTAVSTRFADMAKTGLFRTEVSKDKIWDTYLKSFPEGSNPIYRERTEHDCNCCKQFIRTIGNAVTVVNNELVSVWDINIGSVEPEYQAVANAMAALVKSRPIVNQFLHYETKAGTDRSFEQLTDGSTTTWSHFFVNIPTANRLSERGYVVNKAQIDTVLGETRSTVDVLTRSLKEITIDAIDTVLELIGQNSLYRGEEHKFAVSQFRQLKQKYDKLKDNQKAAFIWATVDSGSVPTSALRIRGTVIGTLLTDLSSDVDMESAVKSYESKVAPSNYKRPSALVTKDMIRKAKETLESLGLTSAMARRYAVVTDITVNNILFADRKAKTVMSGDVFDDLIGDTAATKTKNFDKVEEVPIDKFVNDILPLAQSVEVFVSNEHGPNMVSLIAPADPTAGNMFKWNNSFTWSYNGDVTDSIKEKVKKAGGSVSGDLCCRLAWYNHDDLDFHMVEPNGGHIYYATRSRKSVCGGMLDVDMNAGYGYTREPVENIYYESQRTMKPGKYQLRVHGFSKRESTNVGFDVEVDLKGTLYRFSYAKPVKSGEYIDVAEFNYDAVKGITLGKSLPSTSASRTLWNVATQNFHRVSMIMLSPNHWNGDGVGNKHYFFMIDGCKNDDTARGFYNEFLRSDLDKHRKVFEIVGSKVRTDETDEQLSGLGFSSTQRNSVVVRVNGKFSRIVKVLF